MILINFKIQNAFSLVDLVLATQFKIQKTALVYVLVFFLFSYQDQLTFAPCLLAALLSD